MPRFEIECWSIAFNRILVNKDCFGEAYQAVMDLIDDDCYLSISVFDNNLKKQVFMWENND